MTKYVLELIDETDKLYKKYATIEDDLKPEILVLTARYKNHGDCKKIITGSYEFVSIEDYDDRASNREIVYFSSKQDADFTALQIKSKNVKTESGYNYVEINTEMIAATVDTFKFHYKLINNKEYNEN